MTSTGSFAQVSIHVGDDWRAYCHAYGERMPILSVHAGSSAVSFSVRDRYAGWTAVEFARALVREAQVFAAEVERLHAQSVDSSNGCDGKATDDSNGSDSKAAHGNAA